MNAVLEVLESIGNEKLQSIVKKIKNHQRINQEDALFLFGQELSVLGVLADYIRQRKHGQRTYFNKNFHIEPTNLCVFSCKFCSYSKLYKHREDGWELTIDDMLKIAEKYPEGTATEVHIVGGVHPKMNIEFFAELLRKLKAKFPYLHRKGFTAVELDYIIRKAKLSIEEGMAYFKEAGLESIPGGGAEIFAPHIRNQICEDKCDGNTWLKIHETAHRLGMHSNCTMLYGHLESYEDRIDHMTQLRDLQDNTKGFNCFIPLKFRNHDNDMSYIPEVSIIEDLKMYAVARIFMDNIPNLKAYWPMIGRKTAQLTQSFGVNDLDGTIDDSTKIYSMAGSEEQNPAMSTEEICALILDVGFTPIERDSLYNEVVAK